MADSLTYCCLQQSEMAKKTATEKADKADKTEKGSTSGDKGAGDKTPVEIYAKESEEQPVELGKLSFCFFPFCCERA